MMSGNKIAGQEPRPTYILNYFETCEIWPFNFFLKVFFLKKNRLFSAALAIADHMP